MDPASWLSLTVLVLTVAAGVKVAVGVRKIPRLEDVPAAFDGDAPGVSVIVSALDEADTIEPALTSLLALDYPSLEIVAINDRSSDATPAILDRLAAMHPNLRILHLRELPSGWLGKNHALHQGALIAKGEYLLFTDADVMFEPTTLRRAVAYCQKARVDHLALLFDVVARTQLLRMLIVGFSVGFLLRLQPWKVANSAKHFVGVGGFNLVRAAAYRKAGGHAAIPLALLDDLMLGKLMKENGCRQQVLSARELVSVEWYPGAMAMVTGLEKNTFAAMDFKLRQLLGATALLLLFRLWPWVGLFFAQGSVRVLCAGAVLASLALYADLIRVGGWSYRCLLYAPISGLFELLILWRAVLLALINGGIEWRGTRYPLKELRGKQFWGRKDSR